MERFPYRDTLIFLACGVILISLLLATFIVPLLAPRKAQDPSETRLRDQETRIEIFRAVIEELAAHQTEETRSATNQVIARYNDRIARVKLEEDPDAEALETALRIQVLQWEEEYVLDCIENDEIPAMEGYQYLSRLARIQSMLKRDKRIMLQIGVRIRRIRTLLQKMLRELRNKLPGETPETTAKKLRDIQLKTSRYVEQRLRDEIGTLEYPTEMVSSLILEYDRAIRLLSNPAPSIVAIAEAAEPDLEIMRMGLRFELEQIQLAYEEKRLSRAGAQKMRENVYLIQLDLEDYL